MTSKCNEPARSRRRKQGILLSVLLGVSTVCMAAVSAQDNTSKTNDDPDFQTPMRRDGSQGGDQWNNLRERRRRRLQGEERFDSGGGPGGPGGPPPGGPGGFGPPPGGPGFEGGPGGFGGHHPMGGPGGGMGMFGGGHKALDLTPLNLSEDQKQRIRQIRTGTREQARDVRHTLMQRQMALRNLLFSPDATDAQIRTARKQLRQTQDQLDDLNLNDLLQIRGVLTAEQKQKLPDIAPPPPHGGFGPRGGETIGERGAPGSQGGAAVLSNGADRQNFQRRRQRLNNQ